MDKKKIKTKTPYVILSGIFAAHLGWVFEMVLFYIMYGSAADRGFLTLPICPIYGITIVIVYYLLGTPKQGGILLGGIGLGGLRILLYFVLSVIIPSLAELIGGELIERYTGEVLWSYEHFGYNLGRYVCLPVSLVWGALITTAMSFYDAFSNRLLQIPYYVARRLAVSLSVLILSDFIINFILSLV